MFRPPFSLLLIKVDFSIFKFLYFLTWSKISLLTSVAKVSGVFSTLHTKVSSEIAIVFTILILPYIDISLDDQMFSIFLTRQVEQKSSFWLQVVHRTKKITQGHKLVLHLILDLEVYLFDIVMILTTATLIWLDLFVI